MAIVYSYPLNKNIKLSDELVGTTEQMINGRLKTVTRNFLLQDLTEFFIVDGGLQKTIILTTDGDSGPSTLDDITGVLNIPDYSEGIVDSPITIVNGSSIFSTGLSNTGLESTATQSVFLGTSAGQFTAADDSNFFGQGAGFNAINAYQSNFFGNGSGNSATSANNSNFLGTQAGYEATVAERSNFIGDRTGQLATYASNSNFLGTQAGYGATSANNSNFFGYQVGKSFTDNNIGSNNIIIGTNISLPNATDNSINLGGILFGTGTYSDSGSENPSITPTSGGKIGIGVVEPTNTLHIYSEAEDTSGLRLERLTSASPTSTGQAIGVDASGNIVTVEGSGGSQDLQSVTDIGATTTNTITANSITTTIDSTINGVRVGRGNISGTVSENTAVGYQALQSVIHTTGSTGYYNTAVGDKALKSLTTGHANDAFGDAALNLCTTGTFNLAIGIAAMLNSTTATQNTAIGQYALQNNISGQKNTAIGLSALGQNTASYNTAIGSYAGGAVSSTGTENILVGYQAGAYITSGRNNLLIENVGSNASITSGSYNIILNPKQRSGVTTGSYNTIIGCFDNTFATGLTSNVIIANGLGSIRFQSTDTGLTTVPAQTNTLINGDTTGKAVVTKEYLTNSQTVFVPYTGATTDVNLGLNDITATKLIKDGGFDYQFLKADGSVDNNTYLTSADLPSTLDLYATTSPDPVIAGYTALVRNITDSRYNTVAVDVPTPLVNGTLAAPTLCGVVISDPSVLLGNPGVFNFTVIGNIRRVSGSTSSGADFFYKIYKRDISGTEVFISESAKVPVPANGGFYIEYISTALWNNGIFLSTDRIVLKFYGIQTGGGTGAYYEFLFGGTDPVRGTAAISSAIVPNLYLRDLADVEKIPAENNEILYWNDPASLWEHELAENLVPLATATQKGLVSTTTQTFGGDKTFTGTIGASNLSGTNTGDNATNTQYSGLATSKQDTLQSTVNIKSINGNSILGSGDLTISGTGISSLNGLTGATQTFSATTTTGTGIPAWTSSGTNHRLNIPIAGGATTTGLITGGSQAISGSKQFQSNPEIPVPAGNTTPCIVLGSAGGGGATGTLQIGSTTLYPTALEMQYVKGITSSVQTQLNGKASIIDVAEQTYGLSPSWAGTAPTTIVSNTYQWQQVGSLVTVRVNLIYSTAGSITQVIIPLPADMPTPFITTEFNDALDILYYGVGMFNALSTSVATINRVCFLRRNAANTGFEFAIIHSTAVSSRVISLTLQYFT